MGARANYGSGSRDPSGANDRAEWYRQRDEEIRRARDWQREEEERLRRLYDRSDYGAGVSSQQREHDRAYAERIRREQEERYHADQRERHERKRPCPNCRGDGVADLQILQPDRDGNLTYLWGRETCRICGGRGHF